jgi:hypothetical protein
VETIALIEVHGSFLHENNSTLTSDPKVFSMRECPGLDIQRQTVMVSENNRFRFHRKVINVNRIHLVVDLRPMRLTSSQKNN